MRMTLVQWEGLEALVNYTPRTVSGGPVSRGGPPPRPNPLPAIIESLKGRQENVNAHLRPG